MFSLFWLPSYSLYPPSLSQLFVRISAYEYACVILGSTCKNIGVNMYAFYVGRIFIYVYILIWYVHMCMYTEALSCEVILIPYRLTSLDRKWQVMMEKSHPTLPTSLSVRTSTPTPQTHTYTHTHTHTHTYTHTYVHISATSAIYFRFIYIYIYIYVYMYIYIYIYIYIYNEFRPPLCLSALLHWHETLIVPHQ